MTGVVCDLGVAARTMKNNEILLVKEAKGTFKNCWGLPKGGVDPGESPEDAVLRELFEETGLDGSIIGLSAVRSTISKDNPAVFLCYDVSVEAGDIKKSSEEICDIRWVRLEELKDLNWVSQTMYNLALDGLSGKRMSLKPSRPLSKPSAYNVYNVNHHSNNFGQ